ncbi:uncharacterized protein [Littorina saxatilis]|uniref:Chitin-binding type-2 domain-containing protein n=1 Tax=Littorina saxatilis TaxID=31220 RepID=A0AAN9G141_9CAEN
MSSNQSKASSLFSLLLICILHLVTEVTSKSYYHSDLVLDFLCESRSIPIFVRDVPWDCTSYVVCVQGQAIHTQCPATKLFSWTGQVSKCMPSAEVDTSRCKGQICGYITEICKVNPTARIPCHDSCSRFLDCSLSSAGTLPSSANEGPQFVDYLLECPYPLLFSPATGACQHHSFVTCRDKFEPKAPCDYAQYLQLYNCADHGCNDCIKHHPSCLQLSDGVHPVPLRPDVMMKCQQERTVDFITCPPGYRFASRNASNCVRF